MNSPFSPWEEAEKKRTAGFALTPIPSPKGRGEH